MLLRQEGEEDVHSWWRQKATGLTRPLLACHPLRGPHRPLSLQWGAPCLTLSGHSCPAQFNPVLVDPDPNRPESQPGWVLTERLSACQSWTLRCSDVPLGSQRPREGQELSQGPTMRWQAWLKGL